MKSDLLKVGVIGLGVGQKHIHAFNGHPNCTVTAICDFSKERIENALPSCLGARTTTVAENLLDDPDIDIVSIASYDGYHHDQVVRAIQSNKHVFVEKPLCLHLEEARDIRRQLDRHPGVRISSNLNLRTCPRFIQLRETILSGEMGKVFYIEGDYLWGRLHKLTEGWRKQMAYYSIVHGASVHLIDLLMWMIPGKPVDVCGFGNQMASADSGFKFDDFATVLIRFDNGCVAKVSASGGCVSRHFHQVAAYGTEKTFSHTISGGAWIEKKGDRVIQRDITEAYPAATEKSRIIASFVDSLRTPEISPIVPDDDLFASISVCFAAEAAIRSGSTVAVDYI